MMKRLGLFTIALICSLSVFSQYYAYSTKGNVRLQRNGASRSVYSTMELQETDLIQTDESGCIVVLDRRNDKIFALQSSVPQTLKQLIETANRHTRSLSKEYFQGAMNKLFGKEKAYNKSYESSGGITYRSKDDDAVIAKSLLKQTQSFYPVSFSLLDYYTKSPVGKVQAGQVVLLQVNNLSACPLYVNVMDMNAEGKRKALFPCDESDMMLNLFIPASSNVIIDDYPFSFSPGNTSDLITLVAYPLPFNLQNVIDIVEETDPDSISGFSDNSYEVGFESRTITVF